VPLFSRRLPHVLTRKDLARVLTATYAAFVNVDADEAYERLERVMASQAVLDELYEGLSAALRERQGLRTTEDDVMDKLSKGVEKRRTRVKAAPMTPQISAVMVLLNVEMGIAPEMMRDTLHTPKGRALLDEGRKQLGFHLVDSLIK
jgi:hypothetical protein